MAKMVTTHLLIVKLVLEEAGEAIGILPQMIVVLVEVVAGYPASFPAVQATLHQQVHLKEILVVKVMKIPMLVAAVVVPVPQEQLGPAADQEMLWADLVVLVYQIQ